MDLPAIRLFCSYASSDESYRQDLEKHLALLKRRKLLETWTFRNIDAGDEWKKAIDKHLEAADIILLLVSPDFIYSDYCWDVEMKRALERHEAAQATVIPIILRDCDWKIAEFGKLQALPEAAKPVSRWRPRDRAWANVAEGVRHAVEAASSRLHLQRHGKSDVASKQGNTNIVAVSLGDVPADIERALWRAKAMFQDALASVSNPAVNLLNMLRIDQLTRERFGLGYAPDSWDYLITNLSPRFASELLVAAGLIMPRKSGAGFYDRFRSRLTVPISHQNALRGFAAISVDGSDPVVLLSPASDFFDSKIARTFLESQPELRPLIKGV
jgi:hypothetical protein